MLVDTHTHLYLPEFADDDNGVKTVERALQSGVGHLIFPNVDASTIAPMHELAARFPDNISMAMGLHPTEVTPQWREWSGWQTMLSSPKRYVAIGEIGIDLYWDRTYEQEQMQAFEYQVAKAVELGLPIIIHCREGQPQILEILKSYPQVRGVFHSFGGTVQDVMAIRSVGDFYFGINGIVTFKNCQVKDALHEIGLDRLLLETDAPYLAPVPHRGKRNESAYLTDTARFIANHLGVNYDCLADKTTHNAKVLFNLSYKD